MMMKLFRLASVSAVLLTAVARVNSDDATGLQDALATASNQVQLGGWPRPEARAPLVLNAAFRPGALLNVAQRACSGQRFETLGLLSYIEMSRPIRFYRDQNPVNLLSIADQECPRPIENAVFLIGHKVGASEVVYYKTSAQGEIMQAVRVIGLPSGDTRFERITRITADVQNDFDKFKAELVNRYGAVAQAQPL